MIDGIPESHTEAVATWNLTQGDVTVLDYQSAHALSLAGQAGVPLLIILVAVLSAVIVGYWAVNDHWRHLDLKRPPAILWMEIIFCWVAGWACVAGGILRMSRRNDVIGYLMLVLLGWGCLCAPLWMR